MDDYYDALPWYTFKGERLLRWFDYDDNVTILDFKNQWIDSYDSDYAVDSDGHVYRFDYNIDGFIKVDGARAFDEHNDVITATENDDKFVTMERVYEYKPVKSTSNKLPKGKDKK